MFTLRAIDPDGDPYLGAVTVRNALTDAVVREFSTSLALSGGNSSGTPAPPLPPGSYTWSATVTDPTGSNTAGPASESRVFQVEAVGDTCAVTTSLVDGYVGDTYVHAAAGTVAPDTVQVCLRADDGTTGGVGGIVEASSGDGVNPPVVGTDPNVCASLPETPLPHPLLLGELGDPNSAAHVAFMGDVRVDGDTVVVCVAAGVGGSGDNLVARSITISTPGSNVLPDVSFAPLAAGGPRPDPRPHPAPTAPSAVCQNAVWGSSQLLNISVGAAHTWLYTHVEDDIAQACVRVAGPVNDGARVGVDATGFPGVTPLVDLLASDHPDCTAQIVNVTNPVRVRVFHSAAGANPATVCTGLASVDLSVRIGTSGAPNLPTPIFQRD